jgi:hypothetical protein
MLERDGGCTTRPHNQEWLPLVVLPSTLGLGTGTLPGPLLGQAAAGESAGPGFAHVVPLERQGIMNKTGEGQEAVVEGVPRLGLTRADAARLLAFIRGHGPREPQAHGVRDVPCDADRSPVRGGRIPHGMAACRTTVMWLLCWAGDTNLAATCRRFAAQPTFVLKLIGIELENCMTLKAP